MDTSNYKPGQKFEATVSAIRQQTVVRNCDPWEEGNTRDKLPIYLDFLPRGTFKNAARGSRVQTGSSWVEEAEIQGAVMAGIRAAGYWRRSCIKKELQEYAKGFPWVFS